MGIKESGRRRGGLAIMEFWLVNLQILAACCTLFIFGSVCIWSSRCKSKDNANQVDIKSLQTLLVSSFFSFRSDDSRYCTGWFKKVKNTLHCYWEDFETISLFCIKMFQTEKRKSVINVLLLDLESQQRDQESKNSHSLEESAETPLYHVNHSITS